MSRINIEVLPRVRQKIKESLLAKTERERRSWSWFLERNVAGRKFIANTLATRGVMIPGLESIPESDFEHLNMMIPTPIPIPAIINFCTVLESIPKSDILSWL